MCLTAAAQDTRQVTEPRIPESCVQLPAQLRATSHMLNVADEGKLDTERIQSALDNFRQGMAVELKPSNGNHAFKVERIKLEQAHGRFATVTVGAEGTNLDFSKRR